MGNVEIVSFVNEVSYGDGKSKHPMTCYVNIFSGRKYRHINVKLKIDGWAQLKYQDLDLGVIGSARDSAGNLTRDKGMHSSYG